MSDQIRGRLEYLKKHNLLSSDYSPETLRLAQLVADMPPPPTDDKSIEEWAKRLAADISKFND